jgi:hypothetical protein
MPADHHAARVLVVWFAVLAVGLMFTKYLREQAGTDVKGNVQRQRVIKHDGGLGITAERTLQEFSVDERQWPFRLQGVLLEQQYEPEGLLNPWGVKVAAKLTAKTSVAVADGRAPMYKWSSSDRALFLHRVMDYRSGIVALGPWVLQPDAQYDEGPAIELSEGGTLEISTHVDGQYQALPGQMVRFTYFVDYVRPGTRGADWPQMEHAEVTLIWPWRN